MKILKMLSGLMPLKENPSAHSYVDQCADQGPSRPLVNSLGNVITKFPSRKGLETKMVESLIELFIAMQLELLFLVKRYYPQGPPVMVKRPNKSGYQYERAYHPDLVGETINGAEFAIEAKPFSYIEKDLKSEAPRFSIGEDGQIVDLAANEALKRKNVHHFVVTEKDFGPEFYANASLLGRYVKSRCPSRKLADEMNVVMKATGICTIESLALELESRREQESANPALLNRQLMLECVNWLLVNGEVYGDFGTYSLQDIARFELYATSSLARCRVQDRANYNMPAIVTQQLNLNKEAVIGFAQKSYTYVGAKKGKAFLKDEYGKTDIYDIKDLERHFHDGNLTCSENATERPITPFAQANTERQEKSIRRAEAVAMYESGFRDIPRRTYYEWKRRMNEARAHYGCGLSGLIDTVRKGNREPKACPQAIEYMRDYIMTSYLGCKPTAEAKWMIKTSASRENKNKWQAWGHYKKCAIAEGLHVLSLATFTRAVNRINRKLKELKKAGRKAAYQVEDPRAGAWSGATHGQFAGHIVEIDHTLADLEIIDDDDFGLGRMWLTVAIDTYSRLIVGYHVSFSAPSRRSVMMVIRDMVYRNGYLPMCISLDGGKEFHSIYIDQLLARFRIEKRCRPPHRARYGAIIERLFGTINRDFWHNLLGNTKLMVNPRQVSRDFIAKKRAIWGVHEIVNAFDRYVDEYNTKLVHSSLGVTPRQKHDASYQNLLPLQKRQIKYDQSFLICTMLEPANNRELTCRRGGLNALGGIYSHVVLRKEVNRGRKFLVKYDPNDLRYLYFAHRGIWKQATLTGGVYTHALSEVEVQVLSDIEANKHEGKYRRNLTRLFQKADFAAELKEEEDVLKTRRAEASRHLAEKRHEVVDASGMPTEESEKMEQRAFDMESLSEEPIQTGLFDE